MTFITSNSNKTFKGVHSGSYIGIIAFVMNQIHNIQTILEIGLKNRVFFTF